MTVLAAAQFDPHLGDIAYNLDRIITMLHIATTRGAQLIVFPECAITGYNFASLADARAVAEAMDGPSATTLAAACAELQAHIIVGTLRREGERVYNTALLIGPRGLIGAYDKAHLPLCGADKFTTRGDTGFVVHDTPLGRIGMLICYDLRFPEAARKLALRGADIIALPTNWPTGAETAPEFMARARAFENRVFVVACNRVGEERGARYIGRSCIANPAGQHLADASPHGRGDHLCRRAGDRCAPQAACRLAGRVRDGLLWGQKGGVVLGFTLTPLLPASGEKSRRNFPLLPVYGEGIEHESYARIAH